MRPYNGAIRQDAFHVRIIVEEGKHVVKDASITPTSEALVHTVPLAVFSWQGAPLGPGTQHPEGCFDKATTLCLVTDIDSRMFPQKRQYLLPLVIS